MASQSAVSAQPEDFRPRTRAGSECAGHGEGLGTQGCGAPAWLIAGAAPAGALLSTGALTVA